MSAAANFLTVPVRADRAAQPLHAAGLRILSASHSREHSDEPLTDAELMRHNVEALCSHMLWLRAWWEGHERAIRAADRRAAACIHDHFIDGAGFARSIVRQAGFEMDEERMRNYSWGRSTQTMHMVVGGAQ